MSTLIQFRLSGDDEQEILAAAKQAGMRPSEYIRQGAKLFVHRPDTALTRIEQRLADMEARLATPSASTMQTGGPAALVKGLNADDLIIELRREMRAGVSAFLVLLDGEPLPDIPHSRTPSGQSH